MRVALNRLFMMHIVISPIVLLTRGVIRTKKSAPEQKSAPGGKKRSRGQKKVFPGAPERSTFAELVIFSY
jgi:hypothetical protein